MKNILTIIKKELSRIFKDKRLIFSTIIMPGLMIFVLYSFMGEAISSLYATDSEAASKIVVVDMTEEVTENDLFVSLTNAEYNYEITKITSEELDIYKDKLLNGEIDYIISFSEDFFTKVAAGDKPNVNTYYNPSEEKSSETNEIINSTLVVLEELYIQNKYGSIDMFTINANNNENQVFNEDKAIGQAVSMILPFLIIIFLFSGAMSVAPESIAGDKERGTMATLLVTPIKRSEIAWGKIIALSIISILSALSSFIGIIASLPKLMGLNGGNDISQIYGFSDYLIVFVILLVTVLFIVGLISVVSAIAKNMKEASTFILPLYLISMGVGVSTMFTQTATTNKLLYLIPMYGSLECLVGIFTFDLNIINFLITIVSNLCYTGLLIFLLTKLFNNEKVMFGK